MDEASGSNTGVYFYVDHTSGFSRNTGVQRTVRSIARSLMALPIPVRPVVWDWSNGGFKPAGAEALLHLSRWNGPAVASWAPWDRTGDVLQHPTDAWLMIVELVEGAELIRQAADAVSLKVCWLFHDAIPLRFAQFYGQSARIIRQQHERYMDGLAAFECVVSNSQTSASHLIDHLREKGLRHSHVHPLPLATEFGGVCRLPPPRSAPPPGEPWQLLSVGTLELRKNHLRLFKALAWLQAQQRLPPLILTVVGWAKDQEVVDQLQRAVALGLPVRWEADADDARLIQLYERCDLTLYPSIEEGFGLPVAESLWHHRICVCSAEGALGEISRGGGCCLVDTADWRSLAFGIEAVLRNFRWRQQLQQQIERRACRPWKTYARELVDQLGRADGL